MTDTSDGLLRIDASLDPSRFLRQAGESLAAGDGFYAAILDALPAAVYTTNAAGLITYYNDAAATLWGHRPEPGESAWCGSWKLYWPDGRSLPHDQCPMAMSLRERKPIRGMEAVAERPDGTRVPFIPYPTPLYDGSGNLIGAVNMLVDITDRKQAEKHASEIAAIFESSDDAIISKDLDGTIRSWNPGAERIFGYTAAETVGKPITILIPPDRHNEEPGILQRIVRGERVDPYETVRQRKDGTLIQVSLTVSPIRTADGRIIGASKIARDITERKKTQELMSVLLGETKHRLRNLLTIVQTIAAQTLGNAPKEEREAFLGRLRALATAQETLTLSNLKSVPLREVVGGALAAFQENHRERIVIDGPDDGAGLDAGKVTLLSMALHELATNASKYGALSNCTGQVHVSWKAADAAGPGRIILWWRESGGPIVTFPERRGFGSRLLERALEAELGRANLEFHPSGLVCSLELTTTVG